MNWICCQIGAREHYAVARALHRGGALELLLTDAWLPAIHPLRVIKCGLRERFHPELAKTKVSASNVNSIVFELRSRIAGNVGWPQMIARNNWFQRLAVTKLSRITAGGMPRAIFAYSYAARGIFEFARSRGWKTVLGQIDAGPPEERIVERLYAEDPAQRGQWKKPPSQYWANWREECALADRIVVNSLWSKAALEEEGVPASKIRVVPLAYEKPADAAEYHREYPSAFTRSRPLRVLFLGNICLRKGVGPLFDAIRLLRGRPVEFWFVGALQVSIPFDLRNDPYIRWIGAVPRSETTQFYREADVFMFPTFSDGFGLTQLEAQASALPVIASRNCGNVVEDGRTGLLLNEITGQEIANRLGYLIAKPLQLAQMSMSAVQRAATYRLDCISHNLDNIFET
jgi:glycosyltransferase involved in cell wall biosynthesis